LSLTIDSTPLSTMFWPSSCRIWHLQVPISSCRWQRSFYSPRRIRWGGTLASWLPRLDNHGSKSEACQRPYGNDHDSQQGQSVMTCTLLRTFWEHQRYWASTTELLWPKNTAILSERHRYPSLGNTGPSAPSIGLETFPWALCPEAEWVSEKPLLQGGHMGHRIETGRKRMASQSWTTCSPPRAVCSPRGYQWAWVLIGTSSSMDSKH
jgi:hypothetical protein